MFHFFDSNVKKKLWTPAKLTTELWLDANDPTTITLNGSSVSQWNDKSSNNRHVTQATAANQPLYAVYPNMFTYSEQFNNAVWAKSVSSISATDTIVAPDGTTTAETLLCTAGNNTHSLNQTLTYTTGKAYMLSFYAKANTHNFVQVIFSSTAFGSNAYANFDLANGVLGTVGSETTASMTDVGNGWYRCSIIAMATATSTSISGLYFITSATGARAQVFTAAGTESVYAWGAHLCETATILPYQKTEAVACVWNPSGKPVVSFGAASTVLSAASWGSISQPFTRVFVFAPFAITNTRNLINGYNSSSGDYYSSATQISQVAGGTAANSVTISTKTTYARISEYNGADSKVTMNGNITSGENPGTSGYGGISVGAAHYLSGNSINSFISEVLIINSILSDSDRQKLEGYLAWKWGTVADLPSDHPYKNKPPYQ